jgi:hypothetical protein
VGCRGTGVREPGSPTILAQLRQLETEQARIEQAIADAENAKVKEWLGAMKPGEARELISQWCIQDAWTIEERRAALGALVERIEFDTATGKGRVHYRIGLDGARFDMHAAARDL